MLPGLIAQPHSALALRIIACRVYLGRCCTGRDIAAGTVTALKIYHSVCKKANYCF